MSEKAAKQDLLAIHQARLTALIAGDLEALDRYVSEDLIYTSPSGHTQTKAQVFESFRAGTAKVERMDSDEVEVRMGGNAGIVTYRAQTRMNDRTSVTTGFIRSTATYFKESTGWKLVSQHQSRVE